MINQPMNRRQFTTGAAMSGAAALSAPAFASAHSVDTAGLVPVALSPDGNSTPVLVKAVEQALADGRKGLRLPAGRFHFWVEGSHQRELFISNNDDGLNHILVLLEKVQGFAIVGDNTELIFHGNLTPFVFQESSNIHLAGLSMDWEVPFHCEAVIKEVSADARTALLELTEESSWIVRDGEFYFVGEGFEQVGIKNLLEFDAERRETRAEVYDNFFRSKQNEENRQYSVVQRSDRLLQVTVKSGFRSPPLPGNLMAVMPPDRKVPGIFADRTNDIVLENVHIFHSGCMGLIAQACEDIRMTKCSVVPSGDRFVSTTVDATHFVDCSGTVTMVDCDFSHHIDDAANLHGTYMRISEKLSDTELVMEYVHFQQYGVVNVVAGDLVEIADSDTVEAIETQRVKSVRFRDPQFAVIAFEAPVSAEVGPGDVISVLSRQANFVFQRNKVAKNRARGILIKTAGMVLVEHNYFHAPGSAIRISGGVDHWFESGPVRHVVIRDNEFDHCKYGVWGKSVIDIVCVDKNPSPDAPPYHGLITIVDNVFKTHTASLLTAYRVARIDFVGNTIALEPYINFATPKGASVDVSAVKQLEVAENRITGGKDDGERRVEIVKT